MINDGGNLYNIHPYSVAIDTFFKVQIRHVKKQLVFIVSSSAVTFVP